MIDSAMINRWMLVFALALVTVLVFGYMDQALAQTITDNQVNESFSCSGGGASGQIFTAQGCADGPGDGKVFSYFVCQFEEILNEVLSEVYCGVVWDAKPAVKAALTLLIALTGVAFLMGVTPFTAKELMILAGKFSLVLAFATEAEYMIGIGYNLFIAIAKEGIVIVLDYLFTSQNFNSANDVYELFDQTLADLMNISAEGEKKDSQCDNALFAMVVAIAAAVPPLAIIGAYFIFKLLWVMVRAVFGYCQGLLGVTFLVTLAPIYVSFALFKPTRTLFDKWVQYLISFSFQMVIVFAFLGMMFNILDKMADDVSDYTELVVPYEEEVNQSPGLYNPFDVCGICELAPTNPKEPPKCASQTPVPLTEMTQNTEFLEFATVKIFAIIIIFYILDIMMDFVPQMARYLAGPKYAGQLGGGSQGNMPIPGEQAIGGALNAAAGEFMRSPTSAHGFVRGVVAGFDHAVTSDRGVVDTMIRSAANPNEPFRIDQPGELDNSMTSNLFGAAMGLTGAAAAVGAATGGASAASAASNAGGGDDASERAEDQTRRRERETIEAQQDARETTRASTQEAEQIGTIIEEAIRDLDDFNQIVNKVNSLAIPSQELKTAAVRHVLVNAPTLSRIQQDALRSLSS